MSTSTAPHAAQAKIDEIGNVADLFGRILSPPFGYNPQGFEEAEWEYGKSIEPGIQASEGAEPENLLKLRREEQKMNETLELDLRRLVGEICCRGAVNVQW